VLNSRCQSIDYDDDDDDDVVFTTVTPAILIEHQAAPDDVIHLNVGGQRISTYRSTLTVVSNSILAKLFESPMQGVESVPDGKYRFDHFFDYNPALFNQLLDQLRMIKRQPSIPAYELTFNPPAFSSEFDFSRLIADLGLNGKRLE
jgi:hypothetical protein